MRLGWAWPWYELFRDKTAAPMRVVDGYLTPIVQAALVKAQEERKAGVSDLEGEIGEDDTLLDHLARLIDGSSSSASSYVGCA